jgi:FkbM family methyltransferase
VNELYREALRRAKRLSRFAVRYPLFRLHGMLSPMVTIQTLQGRLSMSTTGEGIAKSLFISRQYEYDSSLRAIRFLKATGFIPPGDICMMDIGSNIGLISTGLLLANEIQRSVAIEPEPNNFRFLTKNVEQNGLSERMRCLQVAVGEKEGTVTMELSGCDPGDHRVRATSTAEAPELQGESSRPTIQVRALTLRQVLELPDIREFAPRPSLLWVDIQGFEGYAFNGGKELLSSGIPTVSEIMPYAILRAGMSLGEFESVVSGIWTDYWLERRERFVRYPMSVFGRYLDELGNDGYYENVIFTKGNPPYAGRRIEPGS